MSASLVGSEMCIRDRSVPVPRPGPPLRAKGRSLWLASAPRARPWLVRCPRLRAPREARPCASQPGARRAYAWRARAAHRRGPCLRLACPCCAQVLARVVLRAPARARARALAGLWPARAHFPIGFHAHAGAACGLRDGSVPVLRQGSVPARRGSVPGACSRVRPLELPGGHLGGTAGHPLARGPVRRDDPARPLQAPSPDYGLPAQLCLPVNVFACEPAPGAEHRAQCVPAHAR
eukprot:4342515-Alexandrium_andersonii.AAC.3